MAAAKHRQLDLPNAVSLAICIQPYKDPADRVSAFGLPHAHAEPVKFGTWEGSVDAGASVNCPVRDAISASLLIFSHRAQFRQKFFPCFVLSVVPEEWTQSSDAYPAAAPGDKCITKRALEAALDGLGAKIPDGVQAIVLRTLPNSSSKRSQVWSGSNPPYLTAQAMAWLRAHGAEHVVVDLPSVDKEDDGGHLVAHRTFWEIAKRGSKLTPPDQSPGATHADMPPTRTATAVGTGNIPLATEHDDDSDVWGGDVARPRHIVPRTITELAMVPEHVQDGEYMLVLAVAPIHMDAAPSDPLLVPYLS